MEQTEIILTINIEDMETASAVAVMAAPYGIYAEDYSELENDVADVAHIDLIDEELLGKDRSKGLIHIYLPSDEDPEGTVSFLSERLNAEKIEFSVEIKPCRDEDWENNWKQYYKPMPIGEKLLIRPVWEENYDSGGRAVINLDPGPAFGTGTHETTRLCLEALEKHITRSVNKDLKMLDVGCGSGILGIAALALGAGSVTAVDIDRQAVRTARENGALNGFSEPELTAIRGNLTENVKGKFNVITANLTADPVIKLNAEIGNFLEKDGVYIVSGIIDSREEEVLESFKDYGFQITGKFRENGWLCFISALNC
ncbi:MAG: 50S ribosomal protein L11 methyltransferase [Oscillospiraceae bacterium]|nr:50S ribosomal protein L11 methyltransferase [Oscillospiraceae bacterium]